MPFFVAIFWLCQADKKREEEKKQFYLRCYGTSFYYYPSYYNNFFSSGGQMAMWSWEMMRWNGIFFSQSTMKLYFVKFCWQFTDLKRQERINSTEKRDQRKRQQEVEGCKRRKKFTKKKKIEETKLNSNVSKFLKANFNLKVFLVQYGFWEFQKKVSS